jgi:hypothetical protein
MAVEADGLLGGIAETGPYGTSSASLYPPGSATEYANARFLDVFPD